MSKPSALLVCRGPLVAVACAALALVAATSQAQDARISTVDLVQSQLTVPKTVTPGKRFIVLDTVENVGETQAPMTVTGFCLAKSDVCGPSDLKFAARRVPALGPGREHANESPLALPDTVAPGAYFLVVTANANNDVQERTRENNVRSSAIEVEAKKK